MKLFFTIYFLVAATATGLFRWLDIEITGIAPHIVEYAALFLFCALFPVVYALSFDRDRPARFRIIRLILMFGLGALIVDLALPAQYELLMPKLRVIKYFTLVPAIIIEIFVAYAMYRIATSGNSSEQSAKSIQEEYGIPLWLAKLFVWEARFWIRVYHLLFRRAS